ncbi:MAG: alkaline phosphatase family protein [Anaerolineae bacterium]|nr:alkaline phosphatase family protein [Anaerolineae bacterium]
MIALPDEFVLPDYTGNTIGNIPATVAALLNIPFTGLPPLRDVLWRPLAGDVRRVIVILLDSMGANILDQEQERMRFFTDEAAVFGRITSVFPSTTVNALSSVWTGAAPAQHGLLGLRLFHSEQAVLSFMITLSPNFKRISDALVDAGLEPESFLAWPGVGEQFTAAGVPTYAFKGQAILDSSLSRMHGRGLTGNYGVFSMADMLVQMGDLLEQKPGESMYINGYWPTIDTISHFRGPLSAATCSETRTLLSQIKALLLDGLSPQARAGTVVFLVADHGQIVGPHDQHVYVKDYPQIVDAQLMRSAGEPRVAYLYARQGRVEELIALINEQCGDRLLAVSAESVLKSGLFGPPPYAPETRHRIGDVVVIARDQALYLNPDEEDLAIKRMVGHHGGLHPDEMIVPWIGFRLDQVAN